MGLLDNLFKPKPNEEIAEQKEKGRAVSPVDPVSPARPSTPPVVAPPPVSPPLATATGAAPALPSNSPPAASPAEPARRAAQNEQEIVLTLADILFRVPTDCLRAGLHDERREVRFKIADLSADIARGRAAVPLSRIAAQCPDVFRTDLTPAEDIDVRLPLQKLVQQIGQASTRPPATVGKPAGTVEQPKPVLAVEPSPPAEASLAGTSAEVNSQPAPTSEQTSEQAPLAAESDTSISKAPEPSAASTTAEPEQRTPVLEPAVPPQQSGAPADLASQEKRVGPPVANAEATPESSDQPAPQLPQVHAAPQVRPPLVLRPVDVSPEDAAGDLSPAPREEKPGAAPLPEVPPATPVINSSENLAGSPGEAPQEIASAPEAEPAPVQIARPMIRPVTLQPPSILAPRTDAPAREPIPAPAAAVTFSPARPAAQLEPTPSPAASSGERADQGESPSSEAPRAARESAVSVMNMAGESASSENATISIATPEIPTAAAQDPASEEAPLSAFSDVLPMSENAPSHWQTLGEELAKLPGVAACLLFSRTSAIASSGSVPAGWTPELARELAFDIAEALHRRAASTSSIVVQFSAQPNDSPAHFFVHGENCICAFLHTRVFLPGVREKLAASAATLARSG